MGSWRKMHCPNSKCEKRFYVIQDALRPGMASTQDFFKFVNHTQTGRVTKEELADWYITNFGITREGAMNMINSNWQFWDVPKSHSFIKLGWFRSTDQGDLDMDEFPPVQEFMKESLARSLALPTTSPALPVTEPCGHALAAPSASAATLVSEEPRGQKRPHSEADTLTEGVLCNVAQRKLSQSEELQCKLRNNLDKGREWFDHFDFDKTGGLEKGELTTALLQTFSESHQTNCKQITSIVDGIWDAIDTNGSGSVCFDEFQMLREAAVAQLCHENVSKAVDSIGQRSK